MSMIHCAQCHASIPIPAELEARAMQCHYCGAVQAVPDLEARQRALAERQRAEAHARQLEHEAHYRQQEAHREAHRDAEERKERRRGVRWGYVTTLFSVLLAPVIISITMFDLPARLGIGGDGADRLALVATQLAERGCTVLTPPSSLYTDGTVTRLVKPEGDRCVRVLAAGGPRQDSLKVRLFDLDGREVAVSPQSSDPQLEHCPPAPGSLRYEIVPGLLDKGQLTHMALSCPSAKAAKAAKTAEGETQAPAEPTKKKPKR